MVKGEDPDRTIIHECLGGYGGNDPFLAAINERWLYIQTLSETDHKRVTFEELYDKDKDPAEMTNLMTSEERPVILKALKAGIRQHRSNVLRR